MAWLSDRRPRFDGLELLPVVVQDADDGRVMMLAWANADALEATQTTGEAHFWSRSRNELWHKGATSGNVLHLVDLAADCDGDAIIYRVRPAGPACHTGTATCFGDVAPGGVLAELEAVIAARSSADPETSHTARLLAEGPRRPAQKVVEEAGEVAIAAVSGTEEELAGEAADLLYHLLVVLRARDLPLSRVTDVLRERRR